MVAHLLVHTVMLNAWQLVVDVLHAMERAMAFVKVAAAVSVVVIVRPVVADVTVIVMDVVDVVLGVKIAVKVNV